MAEKVYIAADGGGTKLLTVLYDGEFNILSQAKSGGTNLLFRPQDVAEAEVRALADELILPDIREIEAFDASIVGPAEYLVNAIRRKCPVKAVRHWGEGHVALASAGVRWGLVAQAGTGSDAFLIQPKGTITVGGWGMTLGDEGGGYDIGLRTLKAAIWAEDGRGPKSVLPELIREAWDLGVLYDMIGKVSGNPDARSLIASVTYLTEKAAAMGDEAALSVYADAGEEMARQVLAVIHNGGGSWIGPIIASGGAWKGSARMFHTFRNRIRAVHPEAEIRFPDFEPIVGSVISRLLAEDPDGAADKMTILYDKFAGLRYRTPADLKEECE
ncbi:MAG: hypothetical protein II889_08645 [Clostridia bacterium]|nr:hypothetical protein [Clostridia bacterium]